jgi:exodeoxyribonuclease VII large subunit
MRQITLYQLNQLIQSTLEQHLESTYWVIAEIGEFRVNQKGHCYMEFVEKNEQKITAKLRANLWAYDFYNLNSLFRSVTGRPLGAGIKILARVVVQFHEVYGLSLLVKDLDPNFTLGERARQKQLVIKRLTSEGIIDNNTCLRLPLVPQRVAVISSSTAAGYGDFVDHLTNNPYKYHFDIELFETVMQGEEAVHSIVKALKKAQQYREKFDLLTIIRGGGSQIDLDCFDSYEVAAEIAQCQLPVVTGIGHQRDDTVADMVAHTRLKTPTAVAEFLINGLASFESQLDYQFDRIKELATSQFEKQRTYLFGLLKNLDHGSRTVINRESHALEMLNQKLLSGAGNCIRESNNRLQYFHEKMSSQSSKLMALSKQRLQLLETKITLADPKIILKRGYSITYLNSKVVKRGTAIEPGDQLDTRLTERKITSTVTKINYE